MERRVMSFAEFCKAGEKVNSTEKGTHDVVNKHYEGEKTGEAATATLEGPKSTEVKGGGVEHTETAKGVDLSDPKNAK